MDSYSTKKGYILYFGKKVLGPNLGLTPQSMILRGVYILTHWSVAQAGCMKKLEVENLVGLSL